MSTVDLSRFSASDIKEVTNWTLLVRAMIGSNPDEHPEIMKAAIDEITEMVNDRWPLETGGSLVIDPEAMETDLSDFSENVRLSFCSRTGLSLFAGIDGPYRTAEVLKGAIDKLASVYDQG
jgi:hypothetical protein